MRLFPNIVLKHEGNMPFENDGLRGGGVKEATVNYIIYSQCRYRSDILFV